VAVYDVLATTVDRMVALYREVERRVRELNPSAPRMEVLSLYETLRVIVGTASERWRNLTYTRTTALDEETREMIWRLLAMYEEVAAACLREVENETFNLSMRNTYLRGKASANFVMLNISPQGATIAPEVLLGELGVVVACAQQLYLASRAAPAGGIPG
jgi:hypothetical protein